MTIKKRATKKAQDKKARDEIAARRGLRDKASTSEKEKDTSSGWEQEYQVEIDDTDEPQTTRAQAKAQAIATSAKLEEAPQSKEGAKEQPQKSGSGSDEEEGQLRYQVECAQCSRNLGAGSHSHLQTKPQEEPRILTSALNKVEEMKHLFDFYGFVLMGRNPDSYTANMVREFTANYMATLEQRTPAGWKVKEQPRLDNLRVQGARLIALNGPLPRF
ncbi:hypothetical protein HAX54_030464 [Datura stramonium]|uniref:Uncharacterized protein n=1 Tax=Datura stramonium TaxID=4076 RepID=A0ABS8SAZ0_DATST|nr:hypothetical protein [Datura stramonium]